MTYQVLARKWRPRQLEEMIGQGPILQILQNALLQKRIHHAYLFSGTRGVGKTTLGRILARCLNCEQGITPNPCGQCPTCVAIDQGKFLDLYEVDAASKTKVEDTRDLLENVPYPPTTGRFKIYLIDEVHMLSNHSFNALLKTLEEPPEYVKFILATTEPKRLPNTILSRCLQFHLKRIMPEQIVSYLQHICDAETITCEPAALQQLVQAADGSMRDALSLLDQAIAFGQGKVHLADVNAMLGCIAKEDLWPLLQALADQDSALLFNHITAFAERACDFKQVLDSIASLLHQITIAQVVREFTCEDMISDLSKRLTPEDVQIFYQIALLGKRDLVLATTPQQGFEMTMLRMLAFKPSVSTQPIKAKTESPASACQKKPVAVAEAPSPAIEMNAGTWRDILPKLELSGMAHALAANCSLSKFEGNNIELAISKQHEAMLNPKLRERIEGALRKNLQRPIHLEIKTTEKDLFTPQKQQRQEQETRLKEATAAIMQDPKVKQLIESCDATIDVSLLN